MEEELRSIRNDEHCYVRFINHTNRNVEIIWINFNGHFERYGFLKTTQYLDVDTFKAHLWIAIDGKTKEKLHIEKEFVYRPKTTKEHILERYPTANVPENIQKRFLVRITLPVISLRYKTLLEISKYFPNNESLNELELPQKLIGDLEKIITQRSEMMVVPHGRIAAN